MSGEPGPSHTLWSSVASINAWPQGSRPDTGQKGKAGGGRRNQQCPTYLGLSPSEGRWGRTAGGCTPQHRPHSAAEYPSPWPRSSPAGSPAWTGRGSPEKQRDRQKWVSGPAAWPLHLPGQARLDLLSGRNQLLSGLGWPLQKPPLVWGHAITSPRPTHQRAHSDSSWDRDAKSWGLGVKEKENSGGLVAPYFFRFPCTQKGRIKSTFLKWEMKKEENGPSSFGSVWIRSERISMKLASQKKGYRVSPLPRAMKILSRLNTGRGKLVPHLVLKDYFCWGPGWWWGIMRYQFELDSAVCNARFLSSVLSPVCKNINFPACYPDPWKIFTQP